MWHSVYAITQALRWKQTNDILLGLAARGGSIGASFVDKYTMKLLNKNLPGDTGRFSLVSFTQLRRMQADQD